MYFRFKKFQYIRTSYVRFCFHSVLDACFCLIENALLSTHTLDSCPVLPQSFTASQWKCLCFQISFSHNMRSPLSLSLSWNKSCLFDVCWKVVQKKDLKARNLWHTWQDKWILFATVYVLKMSHNRDLSRNVCPLTILWHTESDRLHVQPNWKNGLNVCFCKPQIFWKWEFLYCATFNFLMYNF